MKLLVCCLVLVLCIVKGNSENILKSEKDNDIVADDLKVKLLNSNKTYGFPAEIIWKKRFISSSNRKKPLGFLHYFEEQEDNKYAQYDMNTYGSFDNHPCRRVCQQGKNLQCYYKMVIHNYQRLGPECRRCQFDAKACEAEHCIFGDGVPSTVMAINRMVPAPAIEVCENDTIVVDVLNLLSEQTTLHWHGLHMSQTPDMDGAPYVTQYSIQPGEAYRYAFFADRSGSVFYHSHEGWQRAMGVAGSLVIRQTRQANRHAHLYDYDLIEHTLLIQDTFYNFENSAPTNILINGKGRNHLNSLPDNDNRHRYERLRVSSGYRYRMRVISNAVFNCPMEFSIENHKLLMISTDGNDIEPIWADSFFLASAERFDFVLDANQNAGNYWIRLRGYATCANNNLYQGAVLSYRGASRTDSPSSQLPAVSNITRETNKPVAISYLQDYIYDITANRTRIDTTLREDSTNVATAQLRSLFPLPWPFNTRFLTYYSSFGIRNLGNGNFAFQIDEITFDRPGVSLLQAHYLIDENAAYCNRSMLTLSNRNCQTEHCECTNVLQIPAYRPIEMVITNTMGTSHPFHAHGYTFRLVGQGELGSLENVRNVSNVK